MASAAGQKPLILSAIRRSTGSIVYAAAALLLLVVGYLLLSDSFPTVSETVPSPDISSTVAPPPADAPAADP